MPEKEEKSVNEKTKKKGVKTAAAVVVLLVLCCLIGIGIRSVQKRQTYENHIAAAEKYLVDLNYEQAIVEYTLALEIEPNEPALLDALEQTYLDYAQSLADAGDYEGAIAVLEEGAALEIKPDGTALPDALEQTYLDYAQSLAAAEDYEKSIAVLAEGSAKTGRESLQTTEKEYEELKAQKEEEERLAAEAEKKEKKKEAEELISTEEHNVFQIRFVRQQGQNYVSDERVRELCERIVTLLEPYFAGEFGPVSDSADNPYYLSGLKCLADAYYLLGKYDLCMEKRWQIYEMCGSPAAEDLTLHVIDTSNIAWECYYYIPIEHTVIEGNTSSRLVDEYGTTLTYQSQSADGRSKWEYVYSYNEQGKLISTTETAYYDDNKGVQVNVYEYDSSGRLSKLETEYDSYGNSGWHSEYEYHEGGFTEHYWTVINGVEAGYYQDYEIREDGTAFGTGASYGRYGW